MDSYLHHVSGFYANREQAEESLSKLVDGGLPREQLRIFQADVKRDEPAGSNNEVLKDVIVDGAVGAAVGTGIGALAQFALVAANVSLFVASPLIAPLAMLGWGASLGGFVGAALGAGEKQGRFADLVGDAIASGQVVLIAETRSELETANARDLIKASVGDVQDIAKA